MSTNFPPSDPGELLFGRTRGRLLAWLYGHPDERFYLRQLVRQTGAAQGSVQRELDLLARASLLHRTVEGRQVYFQANRESPIFREVQQLLIKTRGAVQVIRNALKSLQPAIEIAFVYGSATKGSVRASSDIDLLVVGRAEFADVVAALAPAQRELGREINPSVYAPPEFVKKIQSGHHFLSAIISEPKAFIIGTEDDLSRLAKSRVAHAAHNQRSRNRVAAARRHVRRVQKEAERHRL